jgi:3-oxoacyl-[acyl-carrier protein] reductase
MDYELKGRTCLVTGSSSGIGAGIVRLFSEQGAKVTAVARRVDKIERLPGITALAPTSRAPQTSTESPPAARSRSW